MKLFKSLDAYLNVLTVNDLKTIMIRIHYFSIIASTISIVGIFLLSEFMYPYLLVILFLMYVSLIILLTEIRIKSEKKIIEIEFEQKKKSIIDEANDILKSLQSNSS